jgi:uncharacterized protein YdeI (YjbR/CyaY-like superfamily)
VKPRFFRSAAELRTWFEKNHKKVEELWIGLQKSKSEKKGVRYSEALDEALAFGWIDGVRKTIDDTTWTIRFTPRRRGSIWSQVNIRRVKALEALGRMTPAGLAVFSARDPARAKLYSFENRDKKLSPAYEKTLRANRKAWSFFQAQPPWYQRVAAFWVMSAKKEETQQRRLATLIEDSGSGRRLKVVSYQKKSVRE